jgi:hypothetical protein
MFNVWLHNTHKWIALIRTVAALTMAGENEVYFDHQFHVMAELVEERPELMTMFTPSDRFFVDFYPIQRTRGGLRKFLRLWQEVERETMSFQHAEELVPRPDLKMKALKQKWASKRSCNSANGGMLEEG